MEDPSPGGEYLCFGYVFIPSELDLFLDFVLLEGPFNFLDLGSLTNHNHYIYCVFPYPDVPSVSNFTTTSSYNA